MSTPAERLGELTPLQKAAVALKEMRARLDALEAARHEPIAIVGLACRFPGADGADAYWDLLESGRDAVGEVPPERWDLARYFDPNPNAPGKINTRHGGFLERVDGFDAAFFGIAPQEAERMDPQQRLLLELAWHALEDAGQPPAALRGTRCGVFVGITQNDYGLMQLAGPVEEIGAYTGTGNGFCFAAGRLAYTLGAQGPAWSVDTACSSSLVAVHQACQALRDGECEIALAAGVQLNLAPQMQIFLARTQSFSPDGRCRSFDETANGFVLGEGVGVLVLRRLRDAQARNDAVRAVIRGSAVNHDGAAGGLTVPNEAAQEALLREALERARLSPDDIDFVEAHGSATPLGDPIEVGALRAVFGGRAPQRPLLLGAVKSNLGHLSAAAGVAGLIKTVLMLERERVVPNLHFSRPSARIGWDGFAVRVPTAAAPWPRQERPRRAGVSGFGLSGTNAHVIIEEAPAPPAQAAAVAERPAHVLALSARTPEALQALARAYAALPPELDLADLCFSANSGRQHFATRLALRAASREELSRGLADFLADPAARQSCVAKGGAGRLALVFGDAIDVAQVRLLARSDASVALALAQCEGVRPDLWQAPRAATLACQIALASLWAAWGLRPDAVAGAGVGRFAALHAAGALDLAEVFAALAGAQPAHRQARIALHLAEDAAALAPALPATLAAAGFATQIGIGADGRALAVDGAPLWLSPHACAPGEPWPALLDALAALYRRGFAIDWAGFDAARSRRRLRLPRYPFEERRFWLEKTPPAAAATEADATPGAAAPLEGLLARQRAAAARALDDIVALQAEFLRRQAAAQPPAACAPAPAPAPLDDLGGWQLLRLAADDAAALDSLGASLEADAQAPLAERHGQGAQRRLLVHRGRDDALAALGLAGAPRDGRRVLEARSGSGRSLAFMFPGVGDHYLRMAAGLYEHAAEFRAHVDHCCDVLAPLLGVDLRTMLYPAASPGAAPATAAPDLRAMLGRNSAPADPAEQRLNETAHAQPAVFVVEYALGRLWQSRGIVPDAMIGYSIGEYTAACLAGVIGLDDALRLVARRAQLIETLPRGALLAVPLSEAQLAPLLGGELALALASTPAMSVVGGPDAQIKHLEDKLRADGIVARRLPGTHAFHTPMLRALHEPLVELVAGFELRAPRIPYVSNLTGRWITAAEATDPAAWARHTWQTVRFADGVAQLLQEGRVFLEVGPGQSLGSFVLQHPAAQRVKEKWVLPSLRNRYERQPDEAFFLTTAGKLWLAGLEGAAGGAASLHNGEEQA